MGEGVGRVDGDFSPPPMVLIVECVNKQTVLIPNMALKAVYGYYINQSNNQFKFKIWKI